ncbi:RNA polymerase sigma factor [Actinoplanes subglobosus]|uniref:RNA polymerase sigma factor n=1 Tax=Actinoplanes subglobosus TaxID=1547892 RepID=A0ABV8IRY0_9ACTN
MPDKEVRNHQLWTLVTAHHTEIVSRLTFRSGNRDLAEELAQEVWVRVGGNPGYFIEHQHPLWELMNIAHDLARNHFRKQKRRGEQQPGDTAITALSDNSLADRMWRGVRRFGQDRRRDAARAVPHTSVESQADPMWYADLRIDLAEAAGELTERQQEALYLHYQQDLSPAAIALRMGISRHAAEKLLGKAFRTLRKSPRLTGWNGKEVDR